MSNTVHSTQMASKLVKPRLLTLNAPTVRNNRALIWLQHQTTTISWSKWDAIVTSIADYEYWSKHNTQIVGLILTHLTEDVDNHLTKLYTISKKVPLVLLSQSILSLKSEEYWFDNFDNIIMLDTVVEQYPFTALQWAKNDTLLSVIDAVGIFAHLCRYNRLIDCPLSEERLKTFHGQLQLDGALMRENRVCVPENIWVITQYFRHTNKERHAELNECVRRNCANPLIDRIVFLNEKDYTKEWISFPGSTKVRQVIIGKRLTYAHYLQYIHDIVPPNTFAILTNLDIYLDTESLKDLWKIPMTNRLLALLRYDVPGNIQDMRGSQDNNAVLFGPRADSQDTWILHAASVKETTWDYNVFNFPLGQPGCDNAFAGHMLQHRYVITNPALTLKTFHLHNSGIRGYTKADTIKSPLYINIAPTHIIDTQQKQVPYHFQCICNELVEFNVQSSSMSNEITYCTMLEKAGRYKWEPSVENHYFNPAIPVYFWRSTTKLNAVNAVSPNGLVYDAYSIYTGKNPEEYPFWDASTIDLFTIMQKRKQMFAIPFASVDLFKHPDTYLLQYISRCLRLKKEFPEYAAASFWIPKEFEPYLSQFAHGLKGEPVYFDKHTACCAEEIIGFVPSELEFGKEDVVGLREILPSWQMRPKGRVCCIIVNDILTKEFIDTVIKPYFSSTWTIRYIVHTDSTVDAFENLVGATMCIFINRGNPVHWAKLWALPTHCCVLEFQQELAIEGEFQHLAHMCEFNSWVLLLSKGTVEDVQQQVIEQLNKWWKKNALELILF